MPALLSRTRTPQSTESALPLTALFASIEMSDGRRGDITADDIRGLARDHGRALNSAWEPLRAGARIRITR